MNTLDRAKGCKSCVRGQDENAQSEKIIYNEP